MADQEQRSIRLQVAGANERDAGKGTARLGEDILKETRASVTPEMEKEYERLAEQLKQESLTAPRRIGFTVNSE